MDKKYTALGLMSGTSMDGVDASIVSSINGIQYDEVFNKYYEYDKDLYQNLLIIRDKICSSTDLKRFSEELETIEKKITLFHAKVVNDINNTIKKTSPIPEIIGFHGQTIFHNSKKKISVQLGNGKLLSQLVRKIVVYNFRQNDLQNDGEGAPLTPIFHKSLKEKIFKVRAPLIFVNIGGITNVTCFVSKDNLDEKMFACDIGPGNCLIDEWIRKNSKKKFDENGLIAKSGNTDKLILNQSLENFDLTFGNSLDIKDFDISFVRGLSLEDGAATVTNFTVEVILNNLRELLKKTKDRFNNHFTYNFIICGGGRKNNYFVNILEKKIRLNIQCDKFQLIDDYGIDGDFVESQAFAFIAIRSYLKLPISFPETTGCKVPITGGMIVKNF
mgnify:CR=1 FL=1|tara:strand:+ start:47 stop:1207 length:1161 start_codon:yes stop_codon:yes gene_type:complete